MNEGLFKERFKKGSGEQTEQGCLTAWWHPNGETVMKWTEEACKDFNEHYCNYCLNKERFPSCPESCPINKWFGEQNIRSDK